MNKKEESKPVHMAKKVEGWYDGKKTVPFNEMSPQHLQHAKIHAQKKELHYFNRAGLFGELSDLLDAEAERRGIELTDYDTDFHKNQRMFKSKLKKSKAEKVLVKSE